MAVYNISGQQIGTIVNEYQSNGNYEVIWHPNGVPSGLYFYKIMADKRQGVIRVFLKYDETGQPIIEGLQRVSKPSRRVYTKGEEIPKVLNGFGTNILSTSKGVMTGGQARKLGVGGEILCAVW